MNIKNIVLFAVCHFPGAQDSSQDYPIIIVFVCRSLSRYLNSSLKILKIFSTEPVGIRTSLNFQQFRRTTSAQTELESVLY